MKIRNNQQTTPIVAQTAQERNTTHTFDNLKRTFETAFVSGKDYTNELQPLATAIVRSVLRTVIDPQRKTAQEKETVSNSGVNPSLLALRRDVTADTALLANTAELANKATALRYSADGDLQTVTADNDALTAVNALIEKALGDGIDLVQEACVAILEQANNTADLGEGWLDRPYTVRRLSKKVLIKDTDRPTWKEEDTTAIQEVYRTLRRYIQNSRAMRTDPRNGYCYLEEMTTAEGDDTVLDTVYRRLSKWADLGGHESTIDGRADRYTADSQTVADYYDIMARLALTDKQHTVIMRRMQGYGTQAIATALGVSEGNIYNTLKAVRVKAEKIGFTPSMWKEMTAEN